MLLGGWGLTATLGWAFPRERIPKLPEIGGRERDQRWLQNNSFLNIMHAL